MKNRIVETKIKELLNTFGAVLIYGPKLCGKTYIAQQLTNSQYFMQDLGNKNYELIKMNKENIILDGKTPRLIDEWQIVPELWDKIRSIVDKANNQKGLYILTGSNSLYNKQNVFHSGAGRIARIKMETLTYCEYFNQSPIKLIDLIENKVDVSIYNQEFKIDSILDYLIYGGWPSIIDNWSLDFSKQYINAIINMHIDQSILKYNSKDALNILKSISRLNTTQIKKQTILKDIDNAINIATLEKYLNVFEDLYLTFNLNPWSSNIRSKYKMRTTVKKYLCDPSLGLSCLNINSTNQLLNDLNTLGIYFENLVIKDLNVFCQANNAEMFFYRNENDEEIDAIIQMPNAKWIAIEIKLTNDYDDINKYVKKLNKVIEQIEPKDIDKTPILKLIITAHGFIYKIDDTYVVPYQYLNLFN